jgi:hypothetical protein
VDESLHKVSDDDFMNDHILPCLEYHKVTKVFTPIMNEVYVKAISRLNSIY